MQLWSREVKSPCCFNAVWKWRRVGNDACAGWSGDAPVQQEPRAYGVFGPLSLHCMCFFVIIPIFGLEPLFFKFWLHYVESDVSLKEY